MPDKIVCVVCSKETDECPPYVAVCEPCGRAMEMARSTRQAIETAARLARNAEKERITALARNNGSVIAAAIYMQDRLQHGEDHIDYTWPSAGESTRMAFRNHAQTAIGKFVELINQEPGPVQIVPERSADYLAGFSAGTKWGSATDWD